MMKNYDSIFWLINKKIIYDFIKKLNREVIKKIIKVGT